MGSTSWEFSAPVIRKARRYLAARRVTADPEVSGLFWVQGGEKRRYRVQTDADRETGTATWINCTCAHGLHAGGGAARCAHAVAVLLATRESIDLTNQLPVNDTQEK